MMKLLLRTEWPGCNPILIGRGLPTKIAFLGFLMTSSLLKLSVMTQMDISFCILLFYIFLRNVMVLIKNLLFYMGFSVSKLLKTILLEKSPNGAQNIFLKIFVWFYRKFVHFSVFFDDVITQSHYLGDV